MRKKWVQMMLAFSAVMVMAGAPIAVRATQSETAENGETLQTEDWEVAECTGEATSAAGENTESSETEATAAENETLELDVNGTKIPILNSTGIPVTSITAEVETEKNSDGAEASEGASGEAGTSEESDDGATASEESGSGAAVSETSSSEKESAGEAGTTYTVTVSTADGDHKFEKADPTQWTDAQLIEENGFFYVTYKDPDGNAAEAVETAEAVTPEQEMTLWTTANVNVREKPDVESAKLTVVPLGGECQVVSILPGWYQVKYGDLEGYMNHRYLSSDKAAVDALVQAEKERAAAAAASQAAAQSSGSSSAQANTGSSSAQTNTGDSGTAAGGNGCLDNGLLN